MFKTAIYLAATYWGLRKLGYDIVKKPSTPVQGMGHDHPLSCYCPHKHPELEKRIAALERR